MRLSGAESLAAIANVFVGMIESSLVVKPYLARMTQSELFGLMTLGMATVAGSVLLAYVQLLGGGDYAGHLVTASLLSAPAGLLIAKVMVPEPLRPTTGGVFIAISVLTTIATAKRTRLMSSARMIGRRIGSVMRTMATASRKVPITKNIAITTTQNPATPRPWLPTHSAMC